MKPISDAADMHADFAGDESTSVMAGDLLSSLTERSRKIDVSAAANPEPEISIAVEEPEAVTTMRPAAAPLAPPPAAPRPSRPRLQIVDGDFPELDDEESTMMMEEPEPTTVAIRTPVKPFPIQPLPAAAPPEPQWTASLEPRTLETLRVPPLPASDLETAPDCESAPVAGSRRLSVLAAAAVGVAALVLGLGHHQPPPVAAISTSAPVVTSTVVEPWDLQTHAKATMESVRASVAALLQWSASEASARNEHADPGHGKHRPAARHNQRG